MSKYVYIVHGSEDGNIGAYGSFKRAREVAVKYVGATEENIEIDEGEYFSYYYSSRSSSAQEVFIEKFIVN